jgi:PAS domain S-box-containing protein
MIVASAELTATEAAQRAVLDAALDCVIRIDDLGRVTYFNESAERTFGYGADEAVGRELADVILPPSYRDAHRRGLARYLETGAANILDRRIELTAIHRDGTEFPVELTVTRIDSPNGPGFIGFVRDITARVSAEEELRAARDRVELIANEQAALRRVATLVARHTTPAELFELVAKEAANLLGVSFISIVRYDAEGGVTLVGVSREATPFVVGASWPLGETAAAGQIWRSHEPASVDVVGLDGAVAEALLRDGLRFATGVPIVVEGRLWGAMTAYEREREALPPEVVSRLESFTELVGTAVANASARSELVAAQRRVIEAADAARERVTRDIHDGAQQQFVNTLINLQLARQKWSSDPGRALELVDVAAGQAEAGIETLRELAAGIHPAILSDQGLGAALDALVVVMPIPVVLEIADLELLPSLEANVYFFCSEALTNVVKHAAASMAWVNVSTRGSQLIVVVRDDGIGGARLGSGGSGLVGLKDRVAALEGTLNLTSPQLGSGTVLVARIPLPA